MLLWEGFASPKFVIVWEIVLWCNRYVKSEEVRPNPRLNSKIVTKFRSNFAKLGQTFLKRGQMSFGGIIKFQFSFILISLCAYVHFPLSKFWAGPPGDDNRNAHDPNHLLHRLPRKPRLEVAKSGRRPSAAASKLSEARYRTPSAKMQSPGTPYKPRTITVQ